MRKIIIASMIVFALAMAQNTKAGNQSKNTGEEQTPAAKYKAGETQSKSGARSFSGTLGDVTVSACKGSRAAQAVALHGTAEFEKGIAIIPISLDSLIFNPSSPYEILIKPYDSTIAYWVSDVSSESIIVRCSDTTQTYKFDYDIKLFFNRDPGKESAKE